MKIKDVHYVPFSGIQLNEKVDDITRYLRLAAEFGCSEEGKKIFDKFLDNIQKRIDEIQDLVLRQTDPDEPDSLKEIRKLRPEGPRKLIDHIPCEYPERLRGAFYGRMAGCTLGAALEFQPIEEMKSWAEHFGDDFPPTNYWSHVKNPASPHYITAKKINLTRNHIDSVPPDDDIMYTLLGLLTMEQCGINFTQEDMAKIWMRFLPVGDDETFGMRGCFWGERIMMKNLKKGISLPEAGVRGNPNLQNIAAWTRADSYGYVCPGWPEKAAELAYRDASINHRRNGVYGSMFMAATISASFVVDDPMEAVRIGLTEIPEDCLFAEGVRWALEQKCTNYYEAAKAVWDVYNGMFNGSALTNALHVVMGLYIGNKDFTKTISETIAMSGDNDCTGATAGSILGAIIGLKGIPSKWIDPFNGRLHIYLNEYPEYIDIEDVCKRFEVLAHRFRSE